MTVDESLVETGQVQPEAGRTLLVSVDEGVATVLLNRPHRLNALDPDLQRALTEAFAELDRDEDVRVIILGATGTCAFSAGADLGRMSSDDEDGAQPYLPMTGVLRNMYETVVECRTPTIAAVHGWVVGGGMELAMACDLRVAADDARFMLPESKVGLGCNFGSQMLPRLVPTGIAFEILYLGEPLSAADAHRHGLVNWLVPADRVLDKAREVAMTLVRRAPLTIRRYKAMVHLGSSLPIATALRLDPGPSPYTSHDRVEGAAAFVEKRPPVWTGR